MKSKTIPTVVIKSGRRRGSSSRREEEGKLPASVAGEPAGPAMAIPGNLATHEHAKFAARAKAALRQVRGR